jgi:hypothetical protein
METALDEKTEEEKEVGFENIINDSSPLNFICLQEDQSSADAVLVTASSKLAPPSVATTETEIAESDTVAASEINDESESMDTAEVASEDTAASDTASSIDQPEDSAGESMDIAEEVSLQKIF